MHSLADGNAAETVWSWSVIAQATLSSEYVLRLLGLTHCKDTLLGDGMMRGVSGGERRCALVVFGLAVASLLTRAHNSGPAAVGSAMPVLRESHKGWRARALTCG